MLRTKQLRWQNRRKLKKSQVLRAGSLGAVSLECGAFADFFLPTASGTLLRLLEIALVFQLLIEDQRINHRRERCDEYGGYWHPERRAEKDR